VAVGLGFTAAILVLFRVTGYMSTLQGPVQRTDSRQRDSSGRVAYRQGVQFRCHRFRAARQRSRRHEGGAGASAHALTCARPGPARRPQWKRRPGRR
jgi:hypothetical protein